MAQPGMQSVVDLTPRSVPLERTLSVLQGPTDPPLVNLTLGDLLEFQAIYYGQQECLIVPWTGARWTYNDLSSQSSALAIALLDAGIKPGDRIAIMAGNCEQYVSVFFAAAKIGAILVILNNAYTAKEALYALHFTEPKMFFTTFMIGKNDNNALLRQLKVNGSAGPKVIIIRGPSEGYTTYDNLVQSADRTMGDKLHQTSRQVLPQQIVNLQFTSGTTGVPKAASLTHHNLVNNARFIGDRLQLTSSDVLCCPPPLFHCFGLVLGLLAVITHGAKVVYPAEAFDPKATLEVLSTEGCTALHGVPAMFDSLFQVAPPDFRIDHLRTGIVAGSPVPRSIMEKMVQRFGMREFTSSYGLTEASPTCFNAFTDDSIDTKLRTVGTLMPHARAKIIDRSGNIVPLGTRGELCISGYQLQAGYWKNEDKTNEAMRRDQDGVLWLHTGDEAVFDDHGYCSITGRFKEIIVRGGENIYPLEIEERLVAHPSISRAVVTGISDKHYVEVVAAFLERTVGQPKPEAEEIRTWVRQTLSKHKAPTHVFWLGEGGVPSAIPLTGSGKVRKFEMAKLGETLLKKQIHAARL